MNGNEKESMPKSGDECDISGKHEKMNNLSVDVNNIESRKNKVFELYSKNYTQTEIAKMLDISQATVSRDIKDVEEEICMQREEWGDNILLNITGILWE